MRRETVGRIGAAGTLAALMACGLASPGAVHEQSLAEENRGHGTQSIVITGDELQRENQPLLDILKRHVPGMQVTYTPECPEVIIRGRSTVSTPSNPSVYVDGQHAVNTCILDGMDPQDIEHIEVYPMGVAPRAQYLNDPYGLILIFLRREND